MHRRRLLQIFVVCVSFSCLSYGNEQGVGQGRRHRKRADDFYTRSDAPKRRDSTQDGRMRGGRRRQPNADFVDADVAVDGSTTASPNSIISNVDDAADQLDEYLPFATLPPLRVDVSDPLKDYNKDGIAAATAGDLQIAHQHFMAASHVGPYRADVWANLALGSLNYVGPRLEGAGAAQARVAGSTEHAMLCESQAAMDISKFLNGVSRPDVEDSLKKGLGSFGGEESCDVSPTAKKRRVLAARAVKLAERDAVAAANMLCRSPQAVRLKLIPQQKQRGTLTASFVRAYLLRMRVCGVVAIENMYDPAFIDELEEAHQKTYEPSSLRGEIETEKVGSRGIGRYEVKWSLEEPFTDPKLTLNWALVLLVKGVLVEDHIELDTFSHVDSMPSASMQHW